MFKRLFGVASAEVNSAIDKIEDPIKMTEQGIRDLKKDLNESLKSLAVVKAEAIRSRKELENAKLQAKDYEGKAMLLLQKAESGAITPDEADRLATQALSRKEQAMTQATTTQKLVQTQEANVSKMEQNVQRLKTQIGNWENELKTLKARHKVSEATTKLNKQLANIDSSSTLGMLERMKEKVDQQEALAESYGEMADTTKSIDEEIDQALLGDGGSSAAPGSSDALAALKAKLAAGKGGDA
ncbi:PspA/IM30 family protein [Flammeovirgaceae bacterium SG7u.111]|nr:PspA/IM30 family protein [Flammeovirgaceae bacterium SG7u.132]WPO38060.1 PspA/IM30 family protein [Flammeovirgaceae bacterium SG7u.111]